MVAFHTHMTIIVMLIMASRTTTTKTTATTQSDSSSGTKLTLSFETSDCDVINITSQDDVAPYEDDTFIWIYTTLRCLQGSITIVVNLMTIAAILNYKQLLTSSNLLILSLSLADTLTGIVPFAIAAEDILERYSDDDNSWLKTCTVAVFISIAGFAGNYTNIVAIACDRYISVRHSLYYRSRVTVAMMRNVVMVMWTMIVVLLICLVALGRKPLETIVTKKSCLWKDFFTITAFQLAVVAFGVCSAVGTLLYMWVGCLAWKRIKRTNPATTRTAAAAAAATTTTGGNNARFKAEQQQRKVTKMMALVVGFYYALYVPACILLVVRPGDKLDYYLNPIGNFIFFMNALINPFIYSWRSKEFNLAYKKMLRLKNRVGAVGPENYF